MHGGKSESLDLGRALIARGDAVMSDIGSMITVAAREIDDAFDREPGKAPRRAGSVAHRLARSVGERLEADAEEMALGQARELARALGLSEPTSTSWDSVAVMRRRLSSRADDAAALAAARAAAVVRIAKADGTATPGELSLRQLRANARTLAQSAAVAAHGQAVLDVARANKKIVAGVATDVTMDTGTTSICEKRADSGWDVESGRALAWSAYRGRFPGRPPWHWGCRTLLWLVMDEEK